jgi:aminoglycoside phosphotransferase (APT) family kinase protein
MTGTQSQSDGVWRPEGLPRRLSKEALMHVLSVALPGVSLGTAAVDVEPLGGGLSNATYAVCVSGLDDRFVLRIYRRDPDVCRIEPDVLRLVRGTVPVPEVVYAAPDGVDGLGPFLLLRWIDGVTFHSLKQSGDGDAIRQAAYAVGSTLAAIGRHTFPSAGRLGEGPAVESGFADGLVDQWLASPQLQSRLNATTRQQVCDYMREWEPRLHQLEVERPVLPGPRRLSTAEHPVHGEMVILEHFRGFGDLATIPRCVSWPSCCCML